MSASRQIFVACSNGSKFVTDNSNYTRWFFYNCPRCLHRDKWNPNHLNGDITFFCTWGRHAACLHICHVASIVVLVPKPGRGCWQLCGGKECLFSGITNSGSLEEGAGKCCSVLGSHTLCHFQGPCVTCDYNNTSWQHLKKSFLKCYLKNKVTAGIFSSRACAQQGTSSFILFIFSLRHRIAQILCCVAQRTNIQAVSYPNHAIAISIKLVV